MRATVARELDGATALDQPRRRVHRRRPLERRAQAGAARQPDPRDPVPGGAPWPRRPPRPPRSSAAAASATTAIAATSRSPSPVPRRRLPGAPLRRVGSGSAARRSARRVRVVLLRTGTRAGEVGRRPAADDAAVPLLRRRPDRIGPPVHAVGAPARLDRDGALDRGHAGGQRPGQRLGAASRDERRIRARARPRAAPPRARCPRPASR